MEEFFKVITSENGKEPGSIWYYAPNKAAPIAFVILFAASGFIHAYQCW
jgi:hypothetical protein